MDINWHTNNTWFWGRNTNAMWAVLEKFIMAKTTMNSNAGKIVAVATFHIWSFLRFVQPYCTDYLLHIFLSNVILFCSKSSQLCLQWLWLFMVFQLISTNFVFQQHETLNILLPNKVLWQPCMIHVFWIQLAHTIYFYMKHCATKYQYLILGIIFPV